MKYLRETKNLSITLVAKITSEARFTIYNILKRELHYIKYNQLVKVIKREKNESKQVNF